MMKRVEKNLWIAVAVLVLLLLIAAVSRKYDELKAGLQKAPVSEAPAAPAGTQGSSGTFEGPPAGSVPYVIGPKEQPPTR